MTLSCYFLVHLSYILQKNGEYVKLHNMLDFQETVETV